METAEQHPLRRWRASRGLSLRALVGLLNQTIGSDLISHPSLARIEQGKQPPSVAVMRAIFNVTHGEVSPNDLVAWCQPRKTPQSQIAA